TTLRSRPRRALDNSPFLRDLTDVFSSDRDNPSINQPEATNFAAHGTRARREEESPGRTIVKKLGGFRCGQIARHYISRTPSESTPSWPSVRRRSIRSTR